jgi:hypothetical protein
VELNSVPSLLRTALELIKCYEILQKTELAIQGKESYKVKGLVGYLMEMEEK